eukprot:3734581-Prymnesium_polylepis.1
MTDSYRFVSENSVLESASRPRGCPRSSGSERCRAARRRDPSPLNAQRTSWPRRTTRPLHAHALFTLSAPWPRAPGAHLRGRQEVPALAARAQAGAGSLDRRRAARAARDARVARVARATRAAHTTRAAAAAAAAAACAIERRAAAGGVARAARVDARPQRTLAASREDPGIGAPAGGD